MPSIACAASGFQCPPVSRTRDSLARTQRSSESTSTPSRSKITARTPTAPTISPILGNQERDETSSGNGAGVAPPFGPPRAAVAAGSPVPTLAVLSGLAAGAGGGPADGVPPPQAATAAPA